jgi:hypothetical protein
VSYVVHRQVPTASPRVRERAIDQREVLPMTEQRREEPPSEEQLDQQMEQIEKDPPQKLEDWPDGPAKYKTFGGPEGDHSYEEGPERQLGPSGVRRHEDGSVTVDGEEVENPEDFKQEALEDPLKKSERS